MTGLAPYGILSLESIWESIDVMTWTNSKHARNVTEVESPNCVMNAQNGRTNERSFVVNSHWHRPGYFLDYHLCIVDRRYVMIETTNTE